MLAICIFLLALGVVHCYLIPFSYNSLAYWKQFGVGTPVGVEEDAGEFSVVSHGMVGDVGSFVPKFRVRLEPRIAAVFLISLALIDLGCLRIIHRQVSQPGWLSFEQRENSIGTDVVSEKVLGEPGVK